MVLRNEHVRAGMIVLAVFALIALADSQAYAERRSISTNLGRFTVPESWELQQVSKDHITARSRDGGTRIDLYERGSERLSEYLHKRANELHISSYVRSVADGYLHEINAGRGAFILGFTPHDSSSTPFLDPALWDGTDWANLRGVAARYLFVVGYVSAGRLFVLEAVTTDLSGGPMLLSDISRSWVLP